MQDMNQKEKIKIIYLSIFLLKVLHLYPKYMQNNIGLFKIIKTNKGR